MAEEKKGCGVEFPHFGASYPDAKCINGYLYDMDSYEDGGYTIGGDDPCPICNTEEWLKNALDDEIFNTKEDALKYVDFLRSKYAHRVEAEEKKTTLMGGGSELKKVEKTPQEKKIETAFNKIWKEAGAEVELDGVFDWRASQLLKALCLSFFEAGAEWQKEQMGEQARKELAKTDITLADLVAFDEGLKLGRRLERQDMLTELDKSYKQAKRELEWFNEGQRQGREQMLKDAVEGEAEELYNDGEIHCTVGVGTYFKPGDEVYVIKKEDKK